jgi:hypothetical protein
MPFVIKRMQGSDCLMLISLFEKVKESLIEAFESKRIRDHFLSFEELKAEAFECEELEA